MKCNKLKKMLFAVRSFAATNESIKSRCPWVLVGVLCAGTLLCTTNPVFAQSEDAKVTASDGAAYDYFGNACSIDGSTAVVGAEEDDHGGFSNAGSAYVYDKDHGGVDNWGQIAILRPDDLHEEDRFGNSVSISGGYSHRRLTIG